MKYCDGRCRRKYFKYEGSANSCRFHRGYTVDIKKNDGKVHELCLKSNLIVAVLRKILTIFLGDIIDVYDMRDGSRKSKSVERSQKIGKSYVEK